MDEAVALILVQNKKKDITRAKLEAEEQILCIFETMTDT